MRRFPLLAAAPLLLVLTALSAPGLSLQPYRPQSLDFELAPGPNAVLGSRAATAGSGVVSRPLRAPARFNVVGLAWKGRARPAIALRVRRDGQAWGRWTPVPAEPADAPDPGSEEPGTRGASGPVWAGHADHVQYRLSRRVPGLRLHFVNSTGSATPASRALSALRRRVNGGLLAVATAFAPEHASARPARPTIRSRSSWGASGCRPRVTPERGSVKVAFVHHTVNANSYSRGDVPGMILGICRYHRNQLGWNDIGYSFVVDKWGRLWEGRAGGVDRPIVGAHTQGYNDQSFGIANTGTFTDRRQTSAALSAMARLIRWKLPLHGQRTAGHTTLVSRGGEVNRYRAGTRVRFNRVSGHRNADATECPGDRLYGQLPELRRRVGNVGPGPPPARLETSIEPRTLRFREPVEISGRLRRPDGRALADAQIRIERHSSAQGWRTLARTETSSSGRFSYELTPSRKQRLRASFPGSRSYGFVAGGSAVVQVEPALEITISPAEISVGGQVELSGTIAPRKSSVVAIAERSEDGEWRRVSARRLSVSDRSFGRSYELDDAGTYRFYARFDGDDSNLRSFSNKEELTVVAR